MNFHFQPVNMNLQAQVDVMKTRVCISMYLCAGM